MSKPRQHRLWAMLNGQPSKSLIWAGKATLPQRALRHGCALGVKYVMTYHGHWAVRCVTTGQVFTFDDKATGLMFMALQV